MKCYMQQHKKMALGQLGFIIIVFYRSRDMQVMHALVHIPGGGGGGLEAKALQFACVD